MDRITENLIAASRAAYEARQMARQMARVEAQARRAARGEHIEPEAAWTAEQARGEKVRAQRRERRAHFELDRLARWPV